MDVRTSLTGPFPRPESLVAATRDLDRGRVERESVEQLRRTSAGEILRLEDRLGLSPATGGYLAWPDLFRPIAEHWGGFSVGPLTRFFETNTFFRQPILSHPPERTPGALLAELPAAQGLMPASRALVILPGPYTLAGLLDNRSGETNEALVHRLGRLLAEELTELRGAGYSTFQFQEPLLVVRPPTGPMAESVVAAYGAIGTAAGNAVTLAWTFFGDAAPVFPLLRRLPVTVVGIDLSETDPKHLSAGERRIGLGLGCVDPRTTLLEDPGVLATMARELRDRLHPSVLWLGPGAPLDLLPYEPATRKLHLLPAARQALTGEGQAG
jgi:5-methyltetrahydropteroyltriglutamate--homocysteine methyltransferase